MSKFNTNPVYLQEKLFNPIRPKQGAKTIINMTALPDYFAYICQKLDTKQKEHLSQYHLQNLLMQYATQGQKVLRIEQEHHHQKVGQTHNLSLQGNQSNLQNVSSAYTSTTRLTTLNSLDKLTNAIIQFIRSRRQYWLKRSTQTQDSQRWKAEQIYDTHMKEIQKIDTMISEQTYNNPQFYKYSNKKKILNDYDCWKYQVANDIQTNKLMVKYSCSVFPYMIQFVQRRRQIIQQYMKVQALARQKQQQQIMQQENQKDQQSLKKQQKQNMNEPKQQNWQQIQQEKPEEQQDNQTPEKQKSQYSELKSNKGQSISSNKKNSDEKIKKIIHYQQRQIISEPTHKLCEILKQCLIYYNLKARSMSSYRNAYFYSYNNRNRNISNQKTSQENIWNIFSKWVEKSQNYQTNILRPVKVKVLIGNKDNIFHQNMLELMVKTADKIQEVDTFVGQLEKIGEKNQENFSDVPVHVIEQDLQRRSLKSQEIDIIANYFITFYRNELLAHIINADIEEKKAICIEQQQQVNKYIFHSMKQLNTIKQEYEKAINDPINTSLTKYKIQGASIPWQDSYYEIFLKYLKEFFKVPTNNRKIAQQMGKQLKKQIQPNHVKHAKGIYFRNMNKRIEIGQCGGGKRGRCLSKEDFIDRDIETFNMKYFKASRKQMSKKRKIRRKKQSSEEDQPVADSQEI